jgi:hypothetical protein
MGVGLTKTAALGYLARGWSVVPAAERGKRPIVRWQTFEDNILPRRKCAVGLNVGLRPT